MKDTFYYILKFIGIGPFYLLFHPKIVGRENIPRTGGVVLAGNHTKWMDPVLIICAVRRKVHFLAKVELFKVFGKYFFSACGCIPVNRKIHDKDALSSAREVLEEGKVIGIFPEGTVNKTDDVTLPFKIGAVKMANDTDSYVVPFVITGKFRVFGKGIKIEFLEKIKIDDDLTKENESLRNIISLKLEEENGHNKED